MLPKLMPMAELLNTHPNPIEYVIEGFLPVAGMSLLVAMPKAGKSTLARNMMLSVGRGVPFLGRSTVNVPIVYLALEEAIEHVSSEFRLLQASTEAIYVRVGHIPRAQVTEVLENDIMERRAGLAVIDPLFDALNVEDVNSYSAMNEALKDILYIARKTRCHIMVLHHTNKRDIHGGLSVLGSQATSGATDHNAFLTLRRDGTRLFETQARVGEAFELSELSFDPTTHRLWIEQTVGESKQDTIAAELLDTLGVLTLTTTDWRSRVRGRHSDKAIAMARLEQEGKIVKVNEGRHTLWRRAQSAEVPSMLVTV